MASFNIVGVVSLRGPVNIKQFRSNLQRQLQGISAPIQIKVDRAAASGLRNVRKEVDAARASVRGLTSDVTKLNTQLQKSGSAFSNVARSNSTTRRAAANISRGANSAGRLEKNTQAAVNRLEEFGRVSGLALRRFAGFSAAAGTVFGIAGAIGSATKDAIDFERQLVKVAQVTRRTRGELRGLTDEIDRLAVGLGANSESLLEVSRILSQTGLSAGQTQRALEALAKSELAPTFGDIRQTAEGAVAIMAQFEIQSRSLEAALGSINAVAGQFAVESEDIISAVRKAGGVFSAAAGPARSQQEARKQLNEFIGLFTSVRATTRESADSIATGLRTIITRLQRLSTVTALREVGVELTNVEGQFVGAFEAFRRLSVELNALDPRDIRFSRIVEELGGFRQVSKTIPAIKEFAKANNAFKAAQEGQASLSRDSAAALETLSVQFAQVREELRLLLRNISETGTFRTLISGTLSLAESFIKLADSLRPIIPLISVIAGFRLFGAARTFLRGVPQGLTATGAAGGGLINKPRRFQEGGFVGQVPGFGNRDDTLTSVAPGSFVLRKKAVERLKDRANQSGQGRIFFDFVRDVQDVESNERFRRSRDDLDKIGGRILFDFIQNAQLPNFQGGGQVRKLRIADKEVSDLRKRAGIQTLQGGGLLRNQNQVGVAILRPVENLSDEAVQVDFRGGNNQKRTKRFNIVRESLSRERFKQFNRAIDRGLVQGANIASAELGGPPIQEDSQGKFLRSLNPATRGRLFENVLDIIDNQGVFQRVQDSRRPFDFPRGLSANLRNDFPRLAGSNIQFIDAKASRSEATASAISSKIRTQLETELKREGRRSVRAPKPGLQQSRIVDIAEGKKVRGEVGLLRERGFTEIDSKTSRRGLQAAAQTIRRRFGFQQGGQVPVLLTPGELVFGPQDVQSIGLNNLRQLNKLQSGGKVPGTGNRDSVLTSLTEGSFVLRKSASEQLESFAQGGLLGIQRLQEGDLVERARARIRAPERFLERAEKALQRVGVRAEDIPKSLGDAVSELEKGRGEVDAIGRAIRAGLERDPETRRIREQARAVRGGPERILTGEAEEPLRRQTGARARRLRAESETAAVFGGRPFAGRVLQEEARREQQIQRQIRSEENREAVRQNTEREARTRGEKQLREEFSKTKRESFQVERGLRAFNREFDKTGDLAQAQTVGLRASQRPRTRRRGFLETASLRGRAAIRNLGIGRGFGRRFGETLNRPIGRLKFTQNSLFAGSLIGLPLLQELEQQTESGGVAAITGGTQGALGAGLTAGALGISGPALPIVAALGALASAANSVQNQLEKTARQDLDRATEDFVESIDKFSEGADNFDRIVENTSKLNEAIEQTIETQNRTRTSIGSAATATQNLLLALPALVRGNFDLPGAARRRELGGQVSGLETFLNTILSREQPGLVRDALSGLGVRSQSELARLGLQQIVSARTDIASADVESIRQAIEESFARGQEIDRELLLAFGRTSEVIQDRVARGDLEFEGAESERLFIEEGERLAQTLREVQIAESTREAQIELTTLKFDQLSAILDLVVLDFEKFDSRLSNLTTLIGGQADILAPTLDNPFENIDAVGLDRLGVAIDNLETRFGDLEIFDDLRRASITVKEVQRANQEALQIALSENRPFQAVLTEILSRRLTFGVSDSVERSIGSATSSRQGGVGEGALVDEPETLRQFTEVQRLQTDAAAQLVEILQEQTNRIAEGLNEFVSVQTKINSDLANVASQRLEIENRVREAAGETLTLEQQRSPLLAQIRTLTGGTTDVSRIQSNIETLLRDRERFQQQFEEEGFSRELGENLTGTNIAINSNIEALNRLSKDTVELSAVEKEIAQQNKRREAARGFVSELATASPTEAFNIQRDIFNTLRAFGGADITTFRPSQLESVQRFTEQVANIFPPQVARRIRRDVALQQFENLSARSDIGDVRIAGQSFREILSDEDLFATADERIREAAERGIEANEALTEFARTQSTSITSLVNNLETETNRLISEALRSLSEGENPIVNSVGRVESINRNIESSVIKIQRRIAPGPVTKETTEFTSGRIRSQLFNALEQTAEGIERQIAQGGEDIVRTRERLSANLDAFSQFRQQGIPVEQLSGLQRRINFRSRQLEGLTETNEERLDDLDRLNNILSELSTGATIDEILDLVGGFENLSRTLRLSGDNLRDFTIEFNKIIDARRAIPIPPVPGAAGGGIVQGVGGPRDDKNLFALSSGEAVLPANVVSKLGQNTVSDLVAGNIRFAQRGFIPSISSIKQREEQELRNETNRIFGQFSPLPFISFQNLERQQAGPVPLEPFGPPKQPSRRQFFTDDGIPLFPIRGKNRDRFGVNPPIPPRQVRRNREFFNSEGIPLFPIEGSEPANIDVPQNQIIRGRGSPSLLGTAQQFVRTKAQQAANIARGALQVGQAITQLDVPLRELSPDELLRLALDDPKNFLNLRRKQGLPSTFTNEEIQVLRNRRLRSTRQQTEIERRTRTSGSRRESILRAARARARSARRRFGGSQTTNPEIQARLDKIRANRERVRGLTNEERLSQARRSGLGAENRVNAVIGRFLPGGKEEVTFSDGSTLIINNRESRSSGIARADELRLARKGVTLDDIAAIRQQREEERAIREEGQAFRVGIERGRAAIARLAVFGDSPQEQRVRQNIRTQLDTLPNRGRFRGSVAAAQLDTLVNIIKGGGLAKEIPVDKLKADIANRRIDLRTATQLILERIGLSLTGDRDIIVEANRNQIGGFARGGIVRGPGGPRDDKAGLFALSSGEAVLPASSVNMLGRNMVEKLIKGQLNFAQEGLAPSVGTPRALTRRPNQQQSIPVDVSVATQQIQTSFSEGARKLTESLQQIANLTATVEHKFTIPEVTVRVIGGSAIAQAIVEEVKPAINDAIANRINGTLRQLNIDTEGGIPRGPASAASNSIGD